MGHLGMIGISSKCVKVKKRKNKSVQASFAWIPQMCGAIPTIHPVPSGALTGMFISLKMIISLNQRRIHLQKSLPLSLWLQISSMTQTSGRSWLAGDYQGAAFPSHYVSVSSQFSTAVKNTAPLSCSSFHSRRCRRDGGNYLRWLQAWITD